MKKATLLLFALSVLAGSCKPDDPSPNPVGTPVSQVSAKINGGRWSTNSAAVQESNGGLGVYGEIVNGGKSSSILLNIKSYTGLAGYAIDSTNKNTAVYMENGSVYNAESGTITVTTKNEAHVAGTFTLEAGNSIGTRSITEGTFDIYR